MPQRGLERRRERTRVRVRVSNGRQVAIVPLIGPEGDVCVQAVCVQAVCVQAVCVQGRQAVCGLVGGERCTSSPCLEHLI